MTSTPWPTTGAATTARAERFRSTRPWTATSTTCSRSSTADLRWWSGTASGATSPWAPPSATMGHRPFSRWPPMSRRCPGWPDTADRRPPPRRRRPSRPVDPTTTHAAAERFFRRMVGDSAWERLPEHTKAARRADGPALAGRAQRHSCARCPLRRVRADRSGHVRTGRALGLPTSLCGGVAARAHARRRTGRDPRRIPRRSSHPPRRIRRPGPDRRRQGRPADPDHPMNILVTGSSGLIGTALVDRLLSGGDDVCRLVRGAPTDGGDTRAGGSAATEVGWDPEGGTIDLDGLDRAGPFDGAVHLAGAGVGDRRWTDRRKEIVRTSRTASTRLLAGTLCRLAVRPPVLVSASAVGYYGIRGDEQLTEASPAGTGFLAERLPSVGGGRRACCRMRHPDRPPPDRHRSQRCRGCAGAPTPPLPARPGWSDGAGGPVPQLDRPRRPGRCHPPLPPGRRPPRSGQCDGAPSGHRPRAGPVVGRGPPPACGGGGPGHRAAAGPGERRWPRSSSSGAST